MCARNRIVTKHIHCVQNVLRDGICSTQFTKFVSLLCATVQCWNRHLIRIQMFLPKLWSFSPRFCAYLSAGCLLFTAETRVLFHGSPCVCCERRRSETGFLQVLRISCVVYHVTDDILHYFMPTHLLSCVGWTAEPSEETMSLRPEHSSMLAAYLISDMLYQYYIRQSIEVSRYLMWPVEEVGTVGWYHAV